MQRLPFVPKGQDSLTLRVHSDLFVLWYFSLKDPPLIRVHVYAEIKEQMIRFL